MQSSHAAAAIDVAFDDANLISDAGLVSVVALAVQVKLPELVAEHLAIEDAVNSAGANPRAKVMSLLAGMSAGADSIDDLDRVGTPGRVCCSTRSVRPRPWVPSCARSPMGTCSS